jgi:flagellar protein FlgJ
MAMNVSPLMPTQGLAPTDDQLTQLGQGKSTAEAAEQFESVFLALVLKQMRQSSFGDGLIPGDDGDIVGGMFDQYMAEHISAGGGMGLAESLAGQLPSRGI